MSERIVSIDEMASFMTRTLITAGADPGHAVKHASLLVTADYRGHFSHGLNRLGKLIQLIQCIMLILLQNCTLMN